MCELYTAKNAQVAASLLLACYLVVVESISGCVRIACSGLMTTRLLQVVNRLDATSFSRLFVTSLIKVVATCYLQQIYQVASSLYFSQT